MSCCLQQRRLLIPQLTTATRWKVKGRASGILSDCGLACLSAACLTAAIVDGAGARFHSLTFGTSKVKKNTEGRSMF